MSSHMNGSGEERVVVSLLDYGAGNVRSVRNAIRRLGYNLIDIVKPEEIEAAAVIVFPGVGAFGSAMVTLEQRGFAEPLRRYIRANRPFFGICIGLQSLFEGSEETPGQPGLGIIPGMVREMDRACVAVPHIGWNSLALRKDSHVTANVAVGETFYFVHSYRALPEPANEEWVLATTTYGEPGASEFISAVQKGNVFAMQFHPEKSGAAGLKLLADFLATRGVEKAASPEGNGSVSDFERIGKAKKTQLVKRIVACLDVRTNDDGDLVVTKGDQYDVRESNGENGCASGESSRKVRNLGKPVELSARYYEEGADEICFLNITSFRQGVLDDAPMLQVLERASECVFVPLTVGGGIRSYSDGVTTYTALEVAARYFRAGADKVSLGSDAVYAAEELIAAEKEGKGPSGFSSIEQISRVYGRQAVVVSIDPKRVYIDSPEAAPGKAVLKLPDDQWGPNGEEFAWYQATVKGGREGRDIDAVALAAACERLGAGEVLLNSVDADGQKKGFDLVLVEAVMKAVGIPVVASSGAGKPEHFSAVFRETGVQAALAAGIFHRKEVAIGDVKEHLAAAGIPSRRSTAVL